MYIKTNALDCWIHWAAGKKDRKIIAVLWVEIDKWLLQLRENGNRVITFGTDTMELVNCTHRCRRDVAYVKPSERDLKRLLSVYHSLPCRWFRPSKAQTSRFKISPPSAQRKTFLALFNQLVKHWRIDESNQVDQISVYSVFFSPVESLLLTLCIDL